MIAGRTSVLTAKVLERASYACYTCLLEMQNVSSSIDGMTVNEYSIWFEETLRSIIQSTSTAINIRRDLCSRITEEELIFEFPFSIPKMGSGDSPKAKGVKTPAKPLGRKASKLTVTDTDINKTASEDGSGSDGQKGAKGFLLSCLQQDLSKVS